MSDLEINIDERVELLFAVKIDGSEKKNARTRLALERSDGVSCYFSGKKQGTDTVLFELPPLANVMKEGKCDCVLEVFVDEKYYFTPMRLEAMLRKKVDISDDIKIESKLVLVSNERQCLSESTPNAQANVFS